MLEIDALYEWCWAKAKRRYDQEYIRLNRLWRMRNGPAFDKDGHPIPLPAKLPKKTKPEPFRMPAPPAKYIVDERIFEDGRYNYNEQPAPGGLLPGSESRLDVPGVRERSVADGEPVPVPELVHAPGAAVDASGQ